ncbi:MAG: hypothetical protein ACRD5J_18655 [Nitrososphaeraceae archaeon]
MGLTTVQTPKKNLQKKIGRISTYYDSMCAQILHEIPDVSEDSLSFI